MKVLFIAYYFDPFPGVGAKRVSYWAKNISELSGGSIQASVVTATPQNDETSLGKGEIIYVKDDDISILKIFFKYDKGITWKNSLKKYFSNSETKFDYDIVVVTGGPFMHFGIGGFLKKRFGCKIILDFRDPFAINPLFKNQNFFKVSLKKFFENKFISKADKIITVNKYCVELLAKNKGTKIEVIENGFDEKILSKIPSDASFNKDNQLIIGYAGKLSHGRNIAPLLSYIEKNDNLRFYYIGDDSEIVENFKNTKTFGTRSYEEALDILAKCDTGLVLTGGNPFESTTKIFDYIGLNKGILVVSERPLKKGSILDVLQQYPNYFLCQNQESDFSKITKDKFRSNFSVKTSSFSRATSLSKLIHVLNELK